MNIGNEYSVNVAQTFASTLSQLKVIVKTIDEIVYKVAVELFKILKSLVLFPNRYIGGKDFSLSGLILRLPKNIISYLLSKNFQPENALFGSGYHRYQEKNLSPKESLQFLKYAAIAGTQDSLDESWIKPVSLKLYDVKQGNFDLSKLSGNTQISDKCFYDETTGLKTTISVRDNEVVVGFGALDAFRHLYNDLPDAEKKLKADHMKKFQNNSILKNIIGFKPELYKQADALFKIIKNHPDFKNKKISISGQSFGGSISQYVAIKNQCPAVCINSVPIGAGLQELLGDNLLSRADKYVTHISVDTDFVSDNYMAGIFDRALSLLGVRTPGNFGRRFRIPSAYSDAVSIHVFVIGSLMAHLGYNNRDNLGALSAADIAIAMNAEPSNFKVEL